MRIETVNIYTITIPFLGQFSTSNSERHSATRVVVEIVDGRGGIKGYGEGLPVESVTGETPQTVVQTVASAVSESSFPKELKEVSQIWDFAEQMPGGKEHHAALCALEMALLDALGKTEKRSILAYLPQHFSASRIRYGAAVTLGDKARIEQMCSIIKSMGIKQLRIKMGSDFEQNKTTLETVWEVFGPDCQTRIDPNGVWDFDTAMCHLPLLMKHRVRIIEEPMARTRRGFVEFAGAAVEKGLTLMACESAPTLHDVEAIIREGWYRMFNVKLCRSGGFHRTLEIIERLRQEKIPFQIGCTLGEGGLLSAAGRALGLACSDAVTYDGSYDRFVLRENIIEEDITFGLGGAAGPLEGHGLGVTVKSETLLRLSDFATTLVLPQ
jgi:L-Ala-D/L-Glu epimerase